MGATSPIHHSDAGALLRQIEENCHHFLSEHCLGKYQYPLDGQFCLSKESRSSDLYGMLDAVYILYTLGALGELTSRDSREVWARRILECQDDAGWFSRKNSRGHPKEHATAYAIGALRLLEIEPDEQYANRARPIVELRNLLTDKRTVWNWLDHMGFEWSLANILNRNLGWHYVWRGSHIGGGIAATIHMLEDVINTWWPNGVSVSTWFAWYFEWLDAHVNPRTGYWQRAFWNRLIKRPTIIDLGGAAHFYWIYGGRGRPFPYPESVIASTLALQGEVGLYRGEKAWCIDLDANYCIIRSYLQLDEESKAGWRDKVWQAIERNAKAAMIVLGGPRFRAVYKKSHEVPGALIALVECGKLDGFFEGTLRRWKHPLDKVVWL